MRCESGQVRSAFTRLKDQKPKGGTPVVSRSTGRGVRGGEKTSEKKVREGESCPSEFVMKEIADSGDYLLRAKGGACEGPGETKKVSASTAGGEVYLKSVPTCKKWKGVGGGWLWREG